MNEKIRQISQVKQSDTFDDTLATGTTLESSSTNLESDLNALRSQIKRIGNMSNWYDQPVPDPDENVKVSANDTTAGYLFEKLIAGTNITITENNDGSNETITITGAGTQITISDTPPVSPEIGELWWDSDGGNLYLWYDDGDSQQWVITIQVTDGKNLLPVEENSVYAGGPKTFELSDTPYNGYVAVYINGLRIDKTDWEITGTTLTVLGDMESGDEVTLDFFIVEPEGGPDGPWYSVYTKHEPILFQMYPAPEILANTYYEDLNVAGQIEFFRQPLNGIAKIALGGNHNTMYSYDPSVNAVYTGYNRSLGISSMNSINPFLVHQILGRYANLGTMSLHFAVRVFKAREIAAEMTSGIGSSTLHTGFSFSINQTTAAFIRHHPTATQRWTCSFNHGTTPFVGDHHITFVLDQGEIRAYHNGVLVNTVVNANYDPLDLGEIYEILTGMNTYIYMDCAISAFMVYGKTLNESEVLELHDTPMFGGEDPQQYNESLVKTIDFEQIYANEYGSVHGAVYPVNARVYLTNDGHFGCYHSGAVNSTHRIETLGIRSRGVANEGSHIIQYNISPTNDPDFVEEFSAFAEFTIPDTTAAPFTVAFTNTTLFEQGLSPAADHVVFIYDGSALRLYHGAVNILTHVVDLIDATRHVAGIVVKDKRFEIWLDGIKVAEDITTTYAPSIGNQTQRLIFNSLNALAPNRFLGYLHKIYFHENRAFTELECQALTP